MTLKRTQIVIDFKGFANWRCYEWVVDGVKKIHATTETHMELLVTLNAARALAAQNEFQVSVFTMLRHNFTNLVIILCSVEMNDANTVTLRIKPTETTTCPT